MPLLSIVVVAVLTSLVFMATGAIITTAITAITAITMLSAFAHLATLSLLGVLLSLVKAIVAVATMTHRALLICALALLVRCSLLITLTATLIASITLAAIATTPILIVEACDAILLGTECRLLDGGHVVLIYDRVNLATSTIGCDNLSYTRCWYCNYIDHSILATAE